jgi:Spy/CpxP family protein refolding chaperone
LRVRIIKIKAKIRSNSRAIPRIFNAEIDYSGLKLISHDLFSGSFINQLETVMKKRNVIIASVATAIVGSGIAFAGSRSCHEGSRYHHGKFGEHKMERIIDKLDSHLDLSDQQEVALQEILESNKSVFGFEAPSRNSLRMKMMGLDPTASDYEESVAAMADEMTEQIKQRTVEAAGVIKQVAGILTDEQIAEARELIAMRMERREGWHHQVDDDEDSE